MSEIHSYSERTSSFNTWSKNESNDKNESGPR